MQHKEQLISIFHEAGIEFSEKISGNTTVLVCKEGDRNVGGYPSFYVEFHFDELGKLCQLKVLE